MNRLLGWQKFIISTGLALLLVCGLAACGKDSQNSGDTKPDPQIENNSQTPQAIEATTGPALAAQVNDDSITLEQFEAEVAANLTALGDQKPADVAAFETEILDRMIDQKLVEQYATANNILITDDMVQAELQTLQDTASQSGSSLEVAFTGYSSDMYAQKVRENLIWQAVSQAVTADVPTTTTQVHARHILVKDEEMGRYVLEQLANGGDFAQLALEFSKDGSTASAGGDLGWISPGDLLQPEVEAILFQMPANSRWPDPIPSSLGYHVVEVLEVAEGRPIDPIHRTALQDQTFTDWLATQRAAANITRLVGNNAQ
ncbi:MAG: peptidylprolyl isomerase [Chloroflexi bacterium]|nr:peptidylprolyl isomerase [Chloroflexota bacterium]